jgi:hypothetical protein
MQKVYKVVYTGCSYIGSAKSVHDAATRFCAKYVGQTPIETYVATFVEYAEFKLPGGSSSIITVEAVELDF